jgi:hypothetical protein
MIRKWTSVLPLALLTMLLLGCGSTNSTETAAPTKKAHTHNSWWCDEHGVPEAMCSMCSKKVAAECRRTGDWCQEHERAKSHCFKCDPTLQEKFAAMYRAKYGKEPPPISNE